MPQSGFYSYYTFDKSLVIREVRNIEIFQITYSRWMLDKLLEQGISPLDDFYSKMGDYKRKEYDKHRRINKRKSKVSK